MRVELNGTVPRPSTSLAAAFFTGAGVMHFARPDFFESIVPEWFRDKRLANSVSGAAEIALGLGLLPARTRRASGAEPDCPRRCCLPRPTSTWRSTTSRSNRSGGKMSRSVGTAVGAGRVVNWVSAPTADPHRRRAVADRSPGGTHPEHHYGQTLRSPNSRRAVRIVRPSGIQRLKRARSQPNRAMMTRMTIESVGDLRQFYRPAAGGAVTKVIGALDEHCRDFLAKSPFFVLSTADRDGRCDGSPKGGAPGFVEMLDEHHVGWADYSGNNRLDSFENVVDKRSRRTAIPDPRAERDAPHQRRGAAVDRSGPRRAIRRRRPPGQGRRRGRRGGGLCALRKGAAPRGAVGGRVHGSMP